jgi:hypothetical protein
VAGEGEGRKRPCEASGSMESRGPVCADESRRRVNQEKRRGGRGLIAASDGSDERLSPVTCAMRAFLVPSVAGELFAFF